MNLEKRLAILENLRNYLLSDDDSWQTARENASHVNGWFTREYIDLAINNIATAYLDRENLKKWVRQYAIPEEKSSPKNIGIVMAGNIPMVGFHDLLCVFITGNKAWIKLSSKDNILLKHVVEKMHEWDASLTSYFVLASTLKNCDAYIATGSNNSSRYFDYYFEKYPHIIRRNRTSVAILTGEESTSDLEKLADDIHLYFGLGCRNVTKIMVPEHYDFEPLLNALKKYSNLIDHHKYKNNYDYVLAIHLLNQSFYMTNGSVILKEDQSLFSPISQLNYEYYTDLTEAYSSLKKNDELQCIVGKQDIPFGKAQSPALTEYADGVDTIQFLLSL